MCVLTFGMAESQWHDLLTLLLRVLVYLVGVFDKGFCFVLRFLLGPRTNRSYPSDRGVRLFRTLLRRILWSLVPIRSLGIGLCAPIHLADMRYWCRWSLRSAEWCLQILRLVGPRRCMIWAQFGIRVSLSQCVQVQQVAQTLSVWWPFLRHLLSWSALILMHFDSSPMFAGDDSFMSTNTRDGFWLTLEVNIFTLFIVWCKIFPDIICGLG